MGLFSNGAAVAPAPTNGRVANGVGPTVTTSANTKGTTTAAATTTVQPRQSAWERAQHEYHQQQQPPTITPVVVTSLLPEAPSRRPWSSLLVLIRSSRQFSEPNLERLYQRYFFKLSATNVTFLQVLLLLLATVQLASLYSGGSSSVWPGVLVGLLVAVLIALAVIGQRPTFSPRQLHAVCLTMLVIMLFLSLLVTALAQPRTSSAGLATNIFLIYMTYTLLPVRMRLSVLAGSGLALTHVICTTAINHDDDFLWKQVRQIYRFNALFKKKINYGSICVKRKVLFKLMYVSP